MERERLFDKIIILDFGSQYTQLIARRVRECGIYSEIHPFNISLEKISSLSPKGIILSGGPSSVYENNAPRCDPNIFNMGIPTLGICYGMQLIAQSLGGKVSHSEKREYGNARLSINRKTKLFNKIEKKGDSISVWMSHGDKIERLPEGFYVLAHSENTPIAAIEDPRRKIYGLQFHPEVVHTQIGKRIIKNFLFEICNCKRKWTMKSFLEDTLENLKDTIGYEKVICALSGGVDSTVVAVLLHKAIGDNLKCIFVDNGLLRSGEATQVINLFRYNFKIPLIYIDAKDLFLKALKGVVDPEEKRKRIGKTFISIFENEAKKIGKIKYLAQGTLYPDVIESVSFRGPSAKIKSHHNVGGLPKRMSFKLIEPLKELFKDEVRKLGRILGLPEKIIKRQPFPGPGLAIRIIGEVTQSRLDLLRKVDEIVLDEMEKNHLIDKVWQSFAILLPVKTVGVMGDERTYENVVAIRVVESQDGMTADWVRIPYEILANLSNRIINEVKGVNRVVYDISSKPPSTIEWE